MNSFERRNKIIEMLDENETVLVSDLSNSFAVSEVTIRSDLRLLEEKGALLRFHGGASRLGTDKSEPTVSEMLLADRFKQASDPKKRIAALATTFVKQGDTVILDSGSTTMLIAEELAKLGEITVVTNNLPAAFILSENQNITLFVCGGTVRHKTSSMHGNITELSLQGISADVMFVGADGIDPEKGITTFNEGYAISGVMAKAAKKVIAVLDSSKFGRRGFNLVLPIEKLDTIITDQGVGEKDQLAFKSKRIELLIAK